MRIDTLPAAQLNADLLAIWSRLQRADPMFDSPYFRPEFTQAVAAVRNDVEVAILEEGNEAIGFFPFQRDKGNVGHPVGGKMSDFHGVVCRQGIHFEPWQLIKCCKLSAWRFDNLIAGQDNFRPYHWTLAGSPYMDLSQGWQGYERNRLAEHKSSYKRITRKLRQTESEVGKVRVEIHTVDQHLFSTMIEWKRKQYQDMGVTDVLSFPWTVALLRQVLTYNEAAFSGVFSVLYFDDILAAFLLSIKSHHVLHAWFSTYAVQFAQYSPGLIFWIELAKAVQDWGVRRIDLGKGPEEYKTHIMSGAIPVAEGSVDARPRSHLLRRHWHRAYHWLRNTPLRQPLLVPGRFIRRMIEATKFQ